MLDDDDRIMQRALERDVEGPPVAQERQNLDRYEQDLATASAVALFGQPEGEPLTKTEGGSSSSNGKGKGTGKTAVVQFCCFFARTYTCRRGNRCKFENSTIPAVTQHQIATGNARFMCEREWHNGSCKHKIRGEHA